MELIVGFILFVVSFILLYFIQILIEIAKDRLRVEIVTSEEKKEDEKPDA